MPPAELYILAEEESGASFPRLLSLTSFRFSAAANILSRFSASLSDLPPAAPLLLMCCVSELSVPVEEQIPIVSLFLAFLFLVEFVNSTATIFGKWPVAGWLGGLASLLWVLALFCYLPCNNYAAPPQIPPFNVTQSRQELLSYYEDLQRHDKVYRKNSTRSLGGTHPVLCIAAIMRDEELFLDEWIAYHLFLGFDYFFICDHGLNASLHHFLLPHIEAGYLTVIPWANLPNITGKSDQLKCYDLAVLLMNSSTLVFL